MSQNKIFDIEGLAKKKLPVSLVSLEGLPSYFFSVIWTRDGSAISLSSVTIAISGTNNFKQLLTEVVTENDGEITIPMGLFPVGTKLDLIFNLFPHQNISASALFITNHSTGQFQQIAPATGNQALTKGKPWSNILTITLQ